MFHKPHGRHLYISRKLASLREVRLSELISPALSLHLTGTYIFLGSFAAREVHRLSELIFPALSFHHMGGTYIFPGNFAARCATSLN